MSGSSARLDDLAARLDRVDATLARLANRWRPRGLSWAVQPAYAGFVATAPRAAHNGVVRRILLGAVLVAAVVSVAVPAGSSATKHEKPYSIKLTIKGQGEIEVGTTGLVRCTSAAATEVICREGTIKVGTAKHLSLRAVAASGWKFGSWKGCHSTRNSCKLSLPHKGQVTANFVTSGNRLDPYPLGWAVPLTEGDGVGWRMTVNSANLNANAEVEAVNGHVPPPAGQQYALVNLTLTLRYGGPIQLRDFTMGRLLAETLKHAYLTAECPAPSPDLTGAVTVNSGQTETGNLCFPIFTKDAGNLMLTATDEVSTSNRTTAQTLWFALH